jgi:DNA-3-methyladenine glycosylase II
MSYPGPMLGAMTIATLQHTGVLPAVSPFDLGQSLRALGGFAPCHGEQRVADGSVRKALALPDGDAVVVDVGPRHDGRSGVSLGMHGAAPLDAATRRGVERAVSDWLGLDDDMAGFLAVAADDPAIAPVLRDLAGLHQVRFASLAEGACYFVLTQRTSQRVAGLRKRRLAAAHGPQAVVDGVRYVAFPGFDRLTRLGPDELGRFTGNLRQTEYLLTLVHTLADLDPDWLRTAEYGEVFAELRRIRGVGEFTASAIMLRVLGRPDRLPLHMPQFAEVATRLYGPDTSMDDVTRRYGRHLGWWGYYAKTALGLSGVPTTHATRRHRAA